MSTVQPIRANQETDAEPSISPSAIRAAIRLRENELKVLRSALQLAEQVGPLLNKNHSAPQQKPKEQNAHNVAAMSATNSNEAPNLRETVMELASGMKKPFTTSNLLDSLLQKGFEFKSNDPKGAVSDAVYELKRSGKLKISVTGKGGMPHSYEVTATGRS